MQQLKQQTQNRMKLMADNYEDDHLKSSSHSNQTNHKPSPDQIIQPLLELDQNRSKLKLYIGHLTALCHDRDPLILRGLTPPASYHLDDDRAAWEKELQKMTQEQLHDELEKGEKESAELQEFANAILQQIADHCPDILEQVVNALEESSWPRPLAPLEQHTGGQAQSVQGAMRVERNVKDRQWNRNFWCTFYKENKRKKTQPTL